MAGWGRGEGMVPERRHEHVPYLYSLSYLATQYINNKQQGYKMQVQIEAHLVV